MFVHLGTPATTLAEAVARPTQTLANYAMGELVTGLRLSYEVAANYKVLAENYNECYHCGPVHPELTRLVPAFGGGGTDIDWDGGVPHREGAWTFTMSRDHHAVSAAGPRRGRADPAQGRAGAPQPHAVRVGGPRRGVRAAAAGGRPHPDRVPAAVPPLRGRRPRVRPVGRRRPVAPGQPAGLGDLRVRAARDVLAVLHARLVRADGARLRRHPSLAAAAAGARPMPERVDYVVVGLGALGSATAHQLARRGFSVLGLERFELGHHRGASHDTSRILRHSYHTPEYVRLTQEAYDDWARLSSLGAVATWSPWSAGSTCSRRTRRSRWPTTPRR